MANTPFPGNQPEQPDDAKRKPPQAPDDVSMGGAADLDSEATTIGHTDAFHLAEEGVADLHGKEPTPSDSFIDLGMPAGPADPFGTDSSSESASTSDASIVEWAALIEDAPPSGSSSAHFDHPSDQDWAAAVVDAQPTDPLSGTGKPAPQPVVEVADLFADAAEIMADAPTHIDATGTPPAPPEPPPADLAAFSQEGSEEQDALAADMEVVRQTFNLDDLDSHKSTPPSGASDVMPPVGLTPEEDVFEEVVDIGSPPAKTGSFSSSGVDLQQLDSGSFEDIIEEVAEEAAASAPSSGVDLGSAELPRLDPSLGQSGLEDDALDAPPSGRDLIAEAVESGVDMRQPLMEIVEEEEAVEATEIVESGVNMQQPLMEIVEEDEALEASEVVESGVEMKQPLMEIVEEEEAVEASEVAEEEVSSAVDLGGPVETESLNREELDALLAGQELGAAADQPVQPRAEGDELKEPETPAEPKAASKAPLLDINFDDEDEVTQASPAAEEKPPAKPEPRKTRVAGRGPIRTTQMQEPDFDEEEAVEAADFDEEVTVTGGEAILEEEAVEVVEEVVVDDAAQLVVEEVVQEEVVEEAFIEEETVNEEVPPGGELIEEEVAVEAGEVVTEDAVVEEAADLVEQEVASADVGEMLEDADDLTIDAGAQDIVLSEDVSTADESVNLEMAGGDVDEVDIDALLEEAGSKSGPDSGVLLDNLNAKELAETDDEEVKLGESAVGSSGAILDDEEVVAEDDAEPATSPKQKPPKAPSRALAWVGGTFLGILLGVGPCVGLYFSGLLPAKGESPQSQSKIAELEKSLADEKTASSTKIAELDKKVLDEQKNAATALDEQKKADTARAALDKMLMDEKKKVETALDEKKTAEAKVTELDKMLTEEKKKVETALDEKKTAETKVATLDKMLIDEKKKLETAVEDKKKVDMALTDEKAMTAKLAADLKAERDVVKDFAAQLAAAKYIDDKADGPRVLQGLKDALKMAQTTDPQGLIRQLQREVSDSRATLKDRWEPQDMLAVWLPVLETRGRKDLTDKALLDAERVLKSDKATPEQKAKAQALIGLALRNDEKYAEAKTILEQAKKGIGDGDPWQARIDAALKEASNPTATYLDRVETLRGKGDYEGAVAALTKTIDTLPAEKRGDLLAERSLLRLEALRARSREPLAANDPVVVAAREDAAQASKAGATQGFYAAGRIAEELGQWSDAVAEYRKAVAANPDLDAKGSRYRVALARALTQAQSKAPPRDLPKDGGMSRLPALDGAADPRQAIALLFVLALQPPMLPAANIEEAQKLADEILKAKPDTIPFEVRAQAMAIKGLYTEALKTYAEGLRTQLKPDYAEGLLQLIEAHPTLKRPESLKIANPLVAEKHYGNGLRWYWERNYANAEKEFLEAIKNDSLDARYHYFLGLARLAQSKPEGREDFAQGARLELQGRPSRTAVSAALERVQGPARRTLNETRNEAR